MKSSSFSESVKNMNNPKSCNTKGHSIKTTELLFNDFEDSKLFLNEFEDFAQIFINFSYKPESSVSSIWVINCVL